MKKRAKYGSLKNTLSEEEYKKYKAELSRRWRKNHPERVRELNKINYLYSKTYPKFRCVCKKCGSKFMGYRKGAKICPVCLLVRKKSLTSKY